MRKALLIVAILIVLVIGGAVAAFVTLDVNRFRPLIVTKLQDAIGRHVELGALHRSWSGGLGLELQGLVIHDDPRFGTAPVLSVEKASARLRLLPLLRRKMEIASITLEQPVVRVVKNAAGQLNVQTMGGPATQQAGAARPQPSGSPAALPLLISAFKIRGALMTYLDQSATPPASIELKGADVTASNMSLVNGVPQMTLEVRNGTLTLSQMRRPLDGIAVDLRATLDALEVTRYSALIGNGRLEGHAAVQHYRATPVVEGELTLRDVLLQDLLPSAQATAEQRLEGKLSGKATVQGTGKSWPELQPTLTGQAELRVAEGRVTNLNLLREALAKFSMLPGVVQRLEAKLPERYRELMQQRDTELREVQLTARIAQGALLIDPLNIGTDVGSLTGHGRVGLDNSMQLEAMIAIPPDLSQAMVSSVEELKYLADRSGAITFPLQVSGQPPRLAVQPDMRYIAQRVIVSKGEELIGELLQKAIGGDEASGTPQPSGQEPASGEPHSPDDFLRAIFGGDESTPQSAPSP